MAVSKYSAFVVLDANAETTDLDRFERNARPPSSDSAGSENIQNDGEDDGSRERFFPFNLMRRKSQP
jgi:hypothetical protein